MGRRNTRAFDDSLRDNNLAWAKYHERLVMLAISMFEWKNMPETVDVRFLELMLYKTGSVVFFKDDAIGYLALKCAANGPLDVYGIPINRRAYAVNGYQHTCDDTNSVIIWNNVYHSNSQLEVMEYAKRLWELDRAIDVNIKAQKTPVLIKCDEKERLTMKNLYMQYDGNQPFIFGDKNLNTNGFEVLKTDAPFVAKNLYDLRTQIYNECLGVLGISNVSYQKRERLISDEVIRSMGGTVANRYTRLDTRRQACEQINEMFGLDISCDYREDFQYIDTREDSIGGGQLQIGG